LRATELAALMMAATRAGAAGGTVASPPELSAAASTDRPAPAPNASSSSRCTSASEGAPRALSGVALRALSGAVSEAADEGFAACLAAALRAGSGGGM
jgi:hypothetical protein